MEVGMADLLVPYVPPELASRYSNWHTLVQQMKSGGAWEATVLEASPGRSRAGSCSLQRWQSEPAVTDTPHQRLPGPVCALHRFPPKVLPRKLAGKLNGTIQT